MAQVVPQLDFMQAIKLAFSRLKETTGRSRRSEFWWAMLAVGVCGAVAGIIVGLIPGIGIWLKSIVNIAVVLVTVPLMMRRLHDAGKNDGLVKAYVILYLVVILLGIVSYYAARSLALGLAATTGLLTDCALIPGVNHSLESFTGLLELALGRATGEMVDYELGAVFASCVEYIA